MPRFSTKRITNWLIMGALLGGATPAAWAQSTVARTPKEMDKFVSGLLKKMTLEEKLGQLNLVTPYNTTGPFANKKLDEKLLDGSAGNEYGFTGDALNKKQHLVEKTRLKIPILAGLDVIHGYRTIFPIPLGLACSWDLPLIQQTARVAAVEASTAGLNWTFSPMVDLTRDPRWGRVMEGSGEDPYLGGLIGAAMIRGYQGDDLTKDDALLACVKHFAMYGAAEGGRDYNTTDMSRLTMYQNYLPPYKMAIEAGAGSVMTSFNEVDGVPATANKWLVTDLLRKQWGFKGFVVTDATATQELQAHGVAADGQQAAALALNAGIDMDMGSELMVSTLKKSLQERKVSQQAIDQACRRVLEAKYKLGLFTNPYRNYDPAKAARVTLTPENRQVALRAAEKSLVLLKNQGQVLPLQKSARVALIGPLANNRAQMLGSWAFMGATKETVTLLEGLQKRSSAVTYAQGSAIGEKSTYGQSAKDSVEQATLLIEALAVARKADVIVAALGENMAMTGEATSQADISLPATQRRLLAALKKTGKPIVWVLFNGRPLTIEAEVAQADAVLEAWWPGTMAGEAVAATLFGEYNPSGKLTMSFPRSVGQIPVYYNHKNTGRPFNPKSRNYTSYYTDLSNEPLFPFGYGLSYSAFTYSPITLSSSQLRGPQTLTAAVQLTNAGKVAGEETVQLYLRDPVASVTRPVKELKSFQKVLLQPGETKAVTFTLTPEELKFYNSDLRYDWESGDFEVFIGTSSADVQTAKCNWLK